MQRELKQYSKAWYEKMQMIWRDRLDAMNIREIKFTTPSLTLHTNLLAPNANIWYAPTKVSCITLNDRCVWGSIAESTRNHRAGIPPTSVFSPAGANGDYLDLPLSYHFTIFFDSINFKLASAFSVWKRYRSTNL